MTILELDTKGAGVRLDTEVEKKEMGGMRGGVEKSRFEVGSGFEGYLPSGDRTPPFGKGPARSCATCRKTYNETIIRLRCIPRAGGAAFSSFSAVLPRASPSSPNSSQVADHPPRAHHQPSFSATSMDSDASTPSSCRDSRRAETGLCPSDPAQVKVPLPALFY